MEHRELRKILVAALAAAGCGRSEPDPPPTPPQPVGPARAGLRPEDLRPPPQPPQPPVAPVKPPVAAGKPFERAACGPSALRTALGVDYVGLRRARFGHHERKKAAAPQLSPYGEAGTACGAAANCAAELDRIPAPGDLWPSLGSPLSSTTTWLVARRGTTWMRATTRKELLALLGPLDHPAKLEILAQATGYRIDCAQPWLLGRQVRAEKSEGTCPVTTFAVTLEIAADGQIRELSKERLFERTSSACSGRRPAGYRDATVAGAAGAYFAHVARLEAASVVAFEILVDELLAHGAPARLVRAARRARLDEIAHAAITGELAARHGARAEAPVIARGGPRSLADLAHENLVEGCVRETWGALEAAWQAQRARDPEVRRAMTTIAADELRHAALSWQVDAWIGARLDQRTRRDAMDAAIAELAAELAYERPAELRELAGLPSVAEAATLLAVLRDLLWTRAAA